jgi:hypothetical protein
MGLSNMTEWVSTVAMAIALSGCAGLRTWLPLLAAGILGRLGFASLGESFAWLQSTAAIVLLGIATALEMIGDKVPVVDHVLDSIGTVARPLAGALVSAAVLHQVDDPLLAGVFGLALGAPIALAPHAIKSGARGLSSVTTMGIANPFLSAFEDLLAIGLAMLAFLVPIAAVVFLAFLTWAVLRWTRRSRRNPKSIPECVDQTRQRVGRGGL